MGADNPAGLDREQALELVKANIGNERTVYHCLASEAIMRALAPRFDADPDLWGLAGLLHDLDYDIVGEDMSRHGDVAARMLADAGASPELCQAVRLHNAGSLGLSRSETFHHALVAAETITGLIVATTLVYPDKKLASVKVKSIKKRMKEKAFARNVSRERVLECETIGIPLPEFAELSLAAMQGIAGEIGL